MLPNSFAHLSFNSQPPEGGWVYYDNQANPHEAVSTHSRPKAAGTASLIAAAFISLFQLTAARRRLGRSCGRALVVPWVSTHSRPKAAGPP